MAKPKFSVQHFIACLNAPWEGTPGPNTLRTLEGVGYVYRIPPDTEFPFEELEFWVYARFYRLGSFAGTRRYSLEVYWHDTAGQVMPVGGRSLGAVRFSSRHAVVSAAWPVRPLVFPGEGMYEFRLLIDRRRPWGIDRRPLRSEFVYIER